MKEILLQLEEKKADLIYDLKADLFTNDEKAIITIQLNLLLSAIESLRTIDSLS